MSHADEPTRLNMTPMIDVVFQLIVFFLVSMRFRTLDMKIEAYLPKDCGVRHEGTPPDVPKLVAVLKRSRGTDGAIDRTTRVRFANETIGEICGDDDRSDATRAALARVSGLAVAARQRAGSAADEIRGEVDASPLVPTGDVVRVVDAFIAGGLRDVTFVGTPPPDAARR